MTTNPNDTTPAGNDGQPLLAERWLLASDDESRLFALPALLARAAAQAPLLAWRLQHGLVQRLPLKALPDKLAEALAGGAAGVNLWADMEADALDALVWQQVPVHRQPHVTWQAWPQAARDANANPDKDPEAALLKALARPDAWAEVAWRLNGCGAPPAVAAVGAVEGAAAAQHATQLATHAAAFAAWAAAQWQSLDSDDLADAKTRDSVHVVLDLPMDEQPGVDASVPTRLMVMELAQPVRAVPGRGRPRLLHGATAMRASATEAGGAAITWTVLHTWEGATVRRVEAASAPSYKVHLQGDGPAAGPHTRLQFRVLLVPEVWAHRTGLQLWFVPEDDVPLQLKLRPLLTEHGMLAGNTPLPADPRGATAHANWLRTCQVVLSAEARSQ